MQVPTGYDYVTGSVYSGTGASAFQDFQIYHKVPPRKERSYTFLEVGAARTRDRWELPNVDRKHGGKFKAPGYEPAGLFINKTGERPELRKFRGTQTIGQPGSSGEAYLAKALNGPNEGNMVVLKYIKEQKFKEEVHANEFDLLMKASSLYVTSSAVLSHSLMLRTCVLRASCAVM